MGVGKGKTDLLLVANGPCIPGTPLVVRDTGIFLNFWGYPAAPCLPCLNPCALTNCSVASVACQLGQPQRPFVGGMTGFRDNPPPHTHTSSFCKDCALLPCPRDTANSFHHGLWLRTDEDHRCWDSEPKAWEEQKSAHTQETPQNTGWGEGGRMEPPGVLSRLSILDIPAGLMYVCY